MTRKTLRYSIKLQWDEGDQIFVVNVPELPGCMTHGKIYEKAVKNTQEVIALWIEVAQELGRPIPSPKVEI